MCYYSSCKLTNLYVMLTEVTMKVQSTKPDITDPIKIQDAGN